MSQLDRADSIPGGGKSHLWMFGAFQVALLGFLATGLLFAGPSGERTANGFAVPVLAVPEAMAASVPSNRIDDIVAAPADAMKPSYILHENRDMFGGDYRRVANADLAQCESLCADEARCRAFTFNKWQGVCFLKESIGRLHIEAQGVTGTAPSERVTLVHTPEIIRKVRSSEFPGSAYKTAVARSYDACATECLSDAQCVGFNFTHQDRHCALMSDLAKPVASKLADGGMKTQPTEADRRKRMRVHEFPSHEIPREIRPLFNAVMRELAVR